MNQPIQVLTVGSTEYNSILREAARIAREETERNSRPKFISAERAMFLLDASEAQMKVYRKNKTIGYTQPSRKVILYNLQSIERLLDKWEIKAVA